MQLPDADVTLILGIVILFLYFLVSKTNKTMYKSSDAEAEWMWERKGLLCVRHWESTLQSVKRERCDNSRPANISGHFHVAMSVCTLILLQLHANILSVHASHYTMKIIHAPISCVQMRNTFRDSKDHCISPIRPSRLCCLKGWVSLWINQLVCQSWLQRNTDGCGRH